MLTHPIVHRARQALSQQVHFQQEVVPVCQPVPARLRSHRPLAAPRRAARVSWKAQQTRPVIRLTRNRFNSRNWRKMREQVTRARQARHVASRVNDVRQKRDPLPQLKPLMIFMLTGIHHWKLWVNFNDNWAKGGRGRGEGRAQREIVREGERGREGGVK